MTEGSNSKDDQLIAETEILTIEKVLGELNLKIPEYQRPYKWQDFHVLKLIDDIQTQSDKPNYRLGTIVLHKKDGKLEIVDGQQRLITVLLIIQAFKTSNKGINSAVLKKIDQNIEFLLDKFEFNSTISKANLQKNYQVIQQEVNKAEFTHHTIEFLLKQCEVVVITLNNISEAFQFFDSQNARGRDLNPHDLLKAFHLREFDNDEREIKIATVKFWEDSNSEDLALLFSKYLYRIRGWINGRSSRFFTKSDVDIFKGVNLTSSANYPSLKALKITHHNIDDLNQQARSRLGVDGDMFSFPFQFDQTIINGRRFFEMVRYYQDFEFLRHKDQLIKKVKLKDESKKILEVISNYSGRYRIGDKYTRGVFNALLMAYYDKFGEHELSSALNKIFIWAYSMRLDYQRLSFASVDNYVLKRNLFITLKEANHPKDFLHEPLPILNDIKDSKKTDEIVTLFKEMGYYNVK